MLFFSSRRLHTRCALVTGVQTCALPICSPALCDPHRTRHRGTPMRVSQFAVAVRKAISGVGDDALLTRAAAVAFYSALSFAPLIEIGRASCRERGWQYV